jgi:hypothetical protein
MHAVSLPVADAQMNPALASEFPASDAGHRQQKPKIAFPSDYEPDKVVDCESSNLPRLKFHQ